MPLIQYMHIKVYFEPLWSGNGLILSFIMKTKEQILKNLLLPSDYAVKLDQCFSLLFGIKLNTLNSIRHLYFISIFPKFSTSCIIGEQMIKKAFLGEQCFLPYMALIFHFKCNLFQFGPV